MVATCAMEVVCIVFCAFDKTFSILLVSFFFFS